jgi:transcriptional regulator with XRE-family HTH domain
MPTGGPTVPRRRLGQALRDLRERAGMTGDEVGSAVERSGSWVSRLEAGRVGLRTRDLGDLLDLYQLTDPGRRAELTQLARESHRRGWWSKYADAISESYAIYIGLEAESRSQLIYDNVVVPGLLQTEAYCRAVLRQAVLRIKPDLIEKRVAVRMARQEQLASVDAPELHIILDEAVLHRSIGGREVLRDQLNHLLRTVQERPLDLRILPFANSERMVIATAFTILTFEHDPDIVYVETATGGVYEHEDEVAAYREVFNLLQNATLDAKGSVALLRQALEGLT